VKRDLVAAIIISLAVHAGFLGLVPLSVLPTGRDAASAGASDSAVADGGAGSIRVVMVERWSSGAAGGTGDAAGDTNGVVAQRPRRAPESAPLPRGSKSTGDETVTTGSGAAGGNDQSAGKPPGLSAEASDDAPADGARTDDARVDYTAAAAPLDQNTPPPESRAARSPRLVTAIEPEYPFRARRLGHEGTVAFTVLVGVDGSVVDMALESSSGHAELDEVARAAVGDASYSPGSSRDPMPLRVRVVFELEGSG